jgi:hypothetical protein
MERYRQQHESPDNEKWAVEQLAEAIPGIEDARLSYLFLLAHWNDVTRVQKTGLVNAITRDEKDGSEMAFRLLRDQPELEADFRDALIEGIVDSGDKTTCSLTLQFIPNLGAWDQRLRDTLSR